MAEITLYTTEELLQLEPPAWLIDGIFPENGFVALYGPPGSGKTFVALDMALSIAIGQPWQGHIVQQGRVIYISAEGTGGLNKRVQAWLNYYQIEEPLSSVYWLLQPITLSEGHDDIEALLSSIADKMMSLDEDYEFQPDDGGFFCPSLIVIDTLARCFIGDENLQEDMGNFIKAVDRLREEFHCAVLVLHHSRKGADTERGSSAFRGAADTLMRVDLDGANIAFTCEKQKEAEAFEQIDLRLQAIETADSCIIRPYENPNATRAHVILETLKNGPLTWSDMCQKTGLNPKEANYPLQLLVKQQKVQRNGKFLEIRDGGK